MSASASNDPSKRESTSRLEQGAVSDASISAVHRQLLREKPEPTEGFSPIPILLLFVFSGLIFFGGVYVSRFSGEFEAMSFSPAQGRSTVGAQGPVQVDPMVLGARLYTQNCAACHQASGQGVPGIYPPLAASEWVTGSEERLVRLLVHGLIGPIEVLGNTYNNAMPAFGPQSGYRFNEERIATVLTYIRASWGNEASAVTAEKVKEVIAVSGNRTAPWTGPELDQYK